MKNKNNIPNKISRAIKESKWLNLTYRNNNDKVTNFWVAITGINIDSRRFNVKIFNSKTGKFDIIEANIAFNNIINAEVLDFTTYERPKKLIEDIENNIDKCQWLNYDEFSNNILNYYIECIYLDNDPSQADYTCIPGVDLDLLKRNSSLLLDNTQKKRIIADIYKYNIKKYSNNNYELVVSRFSIDKGSKKYILCYYELCFDPARGALIIQQELKFNTSFMIKNRKYSIFKYINMDVDEFTRTFEERYDEYKSIIQSNMHEGEKINTLPEMMLISREYIVDLASTYNTIEEKYKKNQLNIPLKSFFGNHYENKIMHEKLNPILISYDKQINIYQMCVIKNSMNEPITYVQGPPGTGKTQTIFNVVLSGFFNNKTVLVCSSNNKPVDGIKEKLELEIKFNDNLIHFPYLRLGNNNEIEKAINKIYKLSQLLINITIDEISEILELIENEIRNNQVELMEVLNREEKRMNNQKNMEKCEKILYLNQSNNNSNLINYVKRKFKKLEKEIELLGEPVTSERLSELCTTFENNNSILSEYFYYKSLLHLSELKKPKYNELLSICSIKDKNECIKSFNTWISYDENMNLLNKAFPIILSTNISTSKLGSPKFMFDLVIMDEASQCNIATALIPINKAKSLLLVGDPNQLKPVEVVDSNVNDSLLKEFNVDKKYSYKKNSILDVMLANDKKSKYILLKNHYRCGRKIIEFSNHLYYNSSLDLSSIEKEKEGELELIDVKNKNSVKNNESYEEAEAIINYLKRNNIEDAYIVTPFVNQRKLIYRMLKREGLDKNNIQCGTVHSLQGAEKSTIIFSLAISPKTSKRTFDWIKNNRELINVAVTRAKDKLVIAGDKESIEILSDGKPNDLKKLIEYVSSKGEILPEKESIRVEIGFSNQSTNENIFYRTVFQFCTCNKRFFPKRNVKISELFPNKTNTIPALYSRLEFDLVLFYLPFEKPVIAFEINGGEHNGNSYREKHDQKKKEICENNKIELIFIPNSFVSDYLLISELIDKTHYKRSYSSFLNN